MTKTEVLDLLKENRDARGEANWKEMGDRTGGLTSFGIGLTKLRAIAKQVGRDHDLALELWNERNHDAKIIGLLIDDPKQLTRDQVKKQVDGAGPGMLSHVLSSCDATLPKSPIAFEIATGWMASKNPVRRSCGYGLVYELAKDKKDKRLTDEFFLGCVEKIGNTIAKEENWVRVGMGGALMSIGKRNKKLNAAAIKLAKAIGPIHFSDGDKKCEPMNVLKHLTSDSDGSMQDLCRRNEQPLVIRFHEEAVRDAARRFILPPWNTRSSRSRNGHQPGTRVYRELDDAEALSVDDVPFCQARRRGGDSGVRFRRAIEEPDGPR